MKATFSIFISKHWDALLASLAACAFLYFFTRHSGIGISPDSVMYQSAASNIRYHFSFTDFNGLPFVDFPVGYPCFLSLIMLLSGLAVLPILPFINCFLFSGVMLLTSVIINGFQKKSSGYKILFLSVLACSPCLLEVYSMLWSETLFIFLCVLFIVCFRYYRSSNRIGSLVLLGWVVAMATVTRYAGISLLFTGGFLILFDGELGMAKKIKHLLIFSILSSSLMVMNLIRNHNVSGHITGVREKAIRTVGDNLYQVGTTVTEWLPFVKGHETIATFLFIGILLIVMIQIIYRTICQTSFRSFENIIGCFFVFYALFIISIASISRFENLSSRLLSPLYIPLLLVSSSWMVGAVKKLTRVKRITFLFAGMLFYIGFQYHQYRLNADAWEGIKDAGIPGYTEDPWTQSATIQFIRTHKINSTEPIFSDANDAVYFLTGIHALPLPHKDIRKEVDSFLQQPTFYVIWFTDGENADLINLDFIKKHKKLISVEHLTDGAIYLFGSD